MENKQKVIHPIPPLYDEDSKILILGSFPSVKSREAHFYYGHPQNRFWKVLASILDENIPETIDEKREMLYRHKIALWDVIAECRIKGSSDASIEDVKINDLDRILKKADIRQIYVNGQTAGKMYERYAKEKFKRDIIILPSTSPANAAYSLDRLINDWNRIMDQLR
ncbi:MAG: DNA-deoxyinosine glycosylase [Erysipelotrichaceae bacterium]|nr:DNA-deoxyinosine glycosylase [Erysipelotrichaceae bacterium]